MTKPCGPQCGDDGGDSHGRSDGDSDFDNSDDSRGNSSHNGDCNSDSGQYSCNGTNDSSAGSMESIGDGCSDVYITKAVILFTEVTIVVMIVQMLVVMTILMTPMIMIIQSPMNDVASNDHSLQIQPLVYVQFCNQLRQV